LVDTGWLTSSNFCSWRLGSNHVPLISTNPLRLRIDDRCNFPQQPDPKLDRPTGVYAGASRTASQVGGIQDGYLITVRCYEPNGESTPDAVGNVSSIWLGIQSPHGFIPNVNIGGGLTEDQLKSYGIATC
jgi:hypothetical protein